MQHKLLSIYKCSMNLPRNIIWNIYLDVKNITAEKTFYWVRRDWAQDESWPETLQKNSVFFIVCGSLCVVYCVWFIVCGSLCVVHSVCGSLSTAKCWYCVWIGRNFDCCWQVSKHYCLRFSFRIIWIYSILKILQTSLIKYNTAH